MASYLDDYNKPPSNGLSKEASSMPRQNTNYTCGPIALRTALLALGQDESEKNLTKALKTTSKDGTSPEAIAIEGKRRGFSITAKTGVSTERLKQLSKKGPVIVLFQDLPNGESEDLETSWDKGHYAVVTRVSYDNVYFVDPASGRKRSIGIGEFENRWHDSHRGKKYRHLAILLEAPEKMPSDGIRISKEAAMEDDKLKKEGGEVFAPQRQQELEAWGRWSQDRNPQDFKMLLDNHRPLMYSAGRRYLQTAKVPRSAVEADMIQHFHRALETYDPNKGAQLNTHIWNHLQHTGRFLRTYTNIGKIPEPRARQIGKFEDRSAMLEEMYGRPATTSELSDDLDMTPQDVDLLRRELRKDIVIDSQTEGLRDIADVSPMAMQQLNFLSMELAPEQQRILEHTYGMNGNQAVDNNEDLARILNMTPQKVRSIKRQIARRFDKRFR